MNWNDTLGMACTISLFIPCAAIIFYRLYHHRSLVALGFSYLITAVYNIMAHGYIRVDQEVVRTVGVINNYLDIPLILLGLMFFCTSRQNRQINMLILVFIAYEVAVAVFVGFKPHSIVYIMGPGLMIVLIHSFFLFTRQVRHSVIFRKNAGRALMLASILFAYSCYTLVYIFYYVLRTKNVADAFLIYFLTSVISCGMMGAGIMMVRKRIHQLQELKNTRRELAFFYS